MCVLYYFNALLCPGMDELQSFLKRFVTSKFLEKSKNKTVRSKLSMCILLRFGLQFWGTSSNKDKLYFRFFQSCQADASRGCLTWRMFLPAVQPTGLVETNVLSFFHQSSKEVKTKRIQTNMVAWVVWAINFKSDFRFNLRGHHTGLITSFSLLISI